MEKKKTDIRHLFNKNNLFFPAALLFFLVYFIVGLSVFRDYGISADELVQRDHSRVAYKYLNEKLLGREIEVFNGVQNLPEYENKYYGVAMQMPLMVIEDLFHFQLSTRHIFLVRHLYNFLVCLLGYICFGLFLNKIFKNKWLALFGTALISLYPRFFAYQFYDIKNMIFAALNMIALLMLVRVVEKCSILNIVLFTFVTAVATNQRIMAVIFPAVLIGYFILKDITKIYDAHKKRTPITFKDAASMLKKYFLIIILYFLFWFIVTPAAWEEPFATFYNTFVGFSNYEKWNGQMTFNGRLITCEERPWYYLFVWFGISIPLIYLILFAAGHVYAVTAFCKSKDKWKDILGKYKWLACSLAVFWGCMGAVIILNARIYEEWRHMFFTFATFCCIAVYGFKFLSEIINKKLIIGIVAICLCVQVWWMVQNHPHEYVYFNTIGRQAAAGFDRDSWRVSNYEMMSWILNNEEDEQFTVYVYPAYNKVVQALFSEEEKSRMNFTREEPEYILENYKLIIGNDLEYEGYEEVYTIWTDNYKIGSVYKRQ